MFCQTSVVGCVICASISVRCVLGKSTECSSHAPARFTKQLLVCSLFLFPGIWLQSSRCSLQSITVKLQKISFSIWYVYYIVLWCVALIYITTATTNNSNDKFTHAFLNELQWHCSNIGGQERWLRICQVRESFKLRCEWGEESQCCVCLVEGRFRGGGQSCGKL